MNLDTAFERFQEMKRQGADIIDIGAESSGPHSQNVSESEEMERILPFLDRIASESDIIISIDTYKSKVAEEALKSGATMINDVTSFRSDPDMAKIIAKYKCPIALMYSKDLSARTTITPQAYPDVMDTIVQFFHNRIEYAENYGIDAQNIILDPGLGHFISSIPKYSYEIISRLKELASFPQPVMLGISRKSFLGGELKDRDQRGLPLSALAYLNGANIVRTHDVKGLQKFFETFD